MTKTKLFYRDRYETGHELDDEYRDWISQFETGKNPKPFHLLEKKWTDNWLLVRYWLG